MYIFFYSKNNLYCPPYNHFPIAFCRDLLTGKKKLLPLKEVKWVQSVPKQKEFTVKRLWEKYKDDETVNIYFQDYSLKSKP